MRRFFWSVISRIWTEYEKIGTRKKTPHLETFHTVLVHKNEAAPRFTYCMKLLKFCFVNRRSRPEAFMGKDVQKICSTFTGERPCESTISIKLQSNIFGMGVLVKMCCIFSEQFFQRTLQDGCFCLKYQI